MCILQILRCILCCEEDDEYERNRRNYQYLPQSCYYSPPPTFKQRTQPATCDRLSSSSGGDCLNSVLVGSIRVVEPQRPKPFPVATQTDRSVLDPPKKVTVPTSCAPNLPKRPSDQSAQVQPTTIGPSVSNLESARKQSCLLGSDPIKKPSITVLGSQKESSSLGSGLPKVFSATDVSNWSKKFTAAASDSDASTKSSVVLGYGMPKKEACHFSEQGRPETPSSSSRSSSQIKLPVPVGSIRVVEPQRPKPFPVATQTDRSVLDPPKKVTVPTSCAPNLPKRSSDQSAQGQPTSIGPSVSNLESARKQSCLLGLDPIKKPSVTVLGSQKESSSLGSGLPKVISATDVSNWLKLKKFTAAASDSDASTKSSVVLGYGMPKKEACHFSEQGRPETPSSSSRSSSQIKLPIYMVPEKTKNLIEKDKVPEILKKPLSPSTYGDYFAALLHAEDHYIEKWDVILKEFKLCGITLKLREEATLTLSMMRNVRPDMDRGDKLDSAKEKKKVYVEFEIDIIPERRPFLLSKDYVYLRRSGKDVEPFRGILLKVVRNRFIHADFGEDFHSQHSSKFNYDVTFSFNRVCLKRSHQAVAAAVDPSFQSILFPQKGPVKRRLILNYTIRFNKFSELETSAIYQILALKGPQPYLLVGGQRLLAIINEAVLQVLRIIPDSRVLIVAPLNRTCDSLMSNLKEEIPDLDMFRANAAFREASEVPDDILSSSLYDGECFTCPPQEKLRNFKVITSTFISSFRLRNHGIYAGHFSHIFVVNACHASEPETMVTLANLATESTAVVLTGSASGFPGNVRSDIARKHGLKLSYFRRLLNSEPYLSEDPNFVKYLPAII